MNGSVPGLNLRVASGFSANSPDGDVVPISVEKGRYLLAYLALNRASEMRREHLQSILWSEKSKKNAQGSLRATLNKLAHEVNAGACADGVDIFSRDRANVYLNIDQITLDVDELLSQAKQGNVDGLIENRFSPDLILHGAETSDEAFCSWLHVIRKSWRDRFVDVLEGHCNGAPTDESARMAQALILIESGHEGAYRHLIEHHALCGNTSIALDLYNELFEHLANEYDVEPAQATVDLISDVKMGRVAPIASPPATVADPPMPPGPSGDHHAATHVVTGMAETAATFRLASSTAPIGLAAHPGLPVIGVAPFAQSGLWRSETYMIDGFRRDLIAALVRFREWMVIDAAPDAPDHAPAAPDYLLEGGYQDNVGRVRLTITLRGREAGAYLWSEPLEFGFDQWLEAQEEIVRRLAIALNVSVSHHHMRRAALERGLSPDLYGRWLQGQDLLLQWRADAHEQATCIFHDIIDQRPDFARAYSSLAQMGNASSIVTVGHLRTAEAKRENVRLAKKAVEVDPLDNRGHLHLAWSRMINAQYDLAELGLRQTSELNANDPWTLVSVALAWAFQGDHESAGRYGRQALQLGLRPTLSHWGYQVPMRHLAGDHEGCVEAAEEAEEVLNNIPAWQAASLVRLGRLEEARRAADRFRKVVRSTWMAAAEPTDAAILDWLIQCFPIRSEHARMAFRRDLIAAGLNGP